MAGYFFNALIFGLKHYSVIGLIAVAHGGQGNLRKVLMPAKARGRKLI